MDRPILVIDDDPDLLRLVRFELEREGFPVEVSTSGAEGEQRVSELRPRVVLLDLGLPDVHGSEVLSRLTQREPDLSVVILTADESPEEVVRCMRIGATDYVVKPFDGPRLTTSVRNAWERSRLQSRLADLSDELRGRHGLQRLLGDSQPVRRAVELLQRAAASDVTVLLGGESGTGKEVAARAIHAESPRRSGPFVVVNCGAIPAGLAESELFGHVRGAFTGASADRAGCFERAGGGTIFLDEVGELTPDLQVRLLRVLQERVIQRVGDDRERPVDVRVLAATHKDLQDEVAQGTFREDLFYRLAVFPVVLPPLRERGPDVLLLAEHFLSRWQADFGRTFEGLSAEVEQALQTYPWPGNVRELENVMQRAVILEDGPRISLRSLSDAVVGAAVGSDVGVVCDAPGPGSASGGAPSVADVRPLEDLEREAIEHALLATGGNMREAARLLAIGRATIYRKVERYGLQRSVS